MRIRRRPQAQAPIPSPLHYPSDPSTAPSQQPPPPPPPSPQPHWLSREEEVVVEEKSRLHRPNVDLGDDPSRPPQPQWQGNNVVGGHSGESAQGRGGQRRQAGAAAAADGHGSLENGHRDEHDRPVISAGEERLADGVIQAMPALTAALHAKKGIKSDVPKRRQSPAVLLEGSRCSRVNGRGWRCSQPTLVGYSLCEHHLGKGRLQSRRATNGGDGGGGRSAGGTKDGRTKPASSRKSAAAMALVTVTAVPMPPTEPANAAAHLRSIHDGTVQ
uniref:Uncharacterized protein n=1 Tax=Avena sativa TaxID=4498 RepID=A0ACD5YU29_AVESA